MNVVCENMLCGICKFEPNDCPVVGSGNTKSIEIRTHREAVMEYYPEKLI